MSHMCDENAPQDNRPRDVRVLPGSPPRSEDAGCAKSVPIPEKIMSKPVLLNTGPMMPLIEKGIARDFEVHRLHEAGDHATLLRKIGPSVPAICTGSHTGVRTDEAMMALCPGLKIIG